VKKAEMREETLERLRKAFLAFRSRFVPMVVISIDDDEGLLEA
jgi:hypothetical protein